MKRLVLNFIIITVLALSAAFIGCKRVDDVYVAGYTVNPQGWEATLWINGEAQKLAGGTVAHSVLVSGKDVYVAGWGRPHGHNVAMLWKNGVPQNLTDGTNHAWTYSVFVSGKDVYVAGSDASRATVWKNGVARTLIEGEIRYTTEARSVFVSDGNVYVAGWDREHQSGKTIATLWKNGVASYLSEAPHSSEARSVIVSGSDVYVLGFESGEKSGAVLWKNGVAQSITDGTDYVGFSSFFVSGSDMYVLGKGHNEHGATIWKNGVPLFHIDLTYAAYITSIFVSGGDVYVTGKDKNARGNDIAIVWKNGIAQHLSDGTYDAGVYSVFVSRKWKSALNKKSDRVAEKTENTENVAVGAGLATALEPEPEINIYGKWGYVLSDSSPYEWRIAPPSITIETDNTMSSTFYESSYTGIVSRIDRYSFRVRILTLWAEGDEYPVEEGTEWTLIYDPDTNLLMYGDDSFITMLTPSEIGEFTRRANAEEANGAYGFIEDPNGNYYHFGGYVSDGNTLWDGMSYTEVFTATSALSPQGNNRYEAENLLNNTDFGGDRNITWCEGVNGHGIGERINKRITTQGFHSEDGIGFYELMIVNGYAKNQNVWRNNSRVKTLRLYVGNKFWCDLVLRDIVKPQIFHFPKHLLIEPHKVGIKIEGADEFSAYQTDLTFEIMEVYPGDRFKDTCITGIALNGYSNVY